jgi:hypothetical protein
MPTPQKKDILEHFILNLLTILNAEISDLKIQEDKKRMLLKLTKTASLIFANENIFMGKKPECFMQTVSIIDLLEIIRSINKESNTVFVLPEQDMFIQTDKYYFSEAIKHICAKLVEHTNKISFVFNAAKKALVIQYGGDMPRITMSPDLMTVLNISNIEENNITFQLSLVVLKMMNIDIATKEGSIELKFK